MGAPFYHLAQVNIAAMRGPLDDPLMADFVARIDEINALAEASPGYVWRWRETGSGPFEDPRTLFNMSVWESVEALRNYVYRSPHAELFRRRQDWFVESGKATTALWWIPAGHEPTPEEAAERLALLDEVGPGPFAFGFRDSCEAPLSPEEVAAEVELLYDRKLLRLVASSNGGDVDARTTFRYRQSGSRVWATYSGGGVRCGALVAVADEQGRLDMRYRHLSEDGRLREGVCESTPSRLPDGRLRLEERWRWTAGADGEGRSTLEEGLEEVTSDA